ncbi:tax1-binding protein 1 homolog isoform X2 [Ostrea edulis]|uniref:tax1-binding protein 1 homolog isoform X2 n=1 Tax=Ostrea edulis TaxID=37623 RepID=UPI0020941875|nr:tax1-binding protein 1 homolog isoform X2 [Ostrea edulis]XP_055995414.1 tax1-binding protein 1 homolog isoform X2 [Ostrea edulis]XP_055995415.1 tax1-binding protein 1 homolog isoform X2 [Ostrea edulis]
MEEETTGNLSRPREASPQKRPEFAAVVFQCIPETYPADAHIECRYTITPDLIPTSRDWVGLYKVGWMTTRDYYYYEWAQTPAGYEAGKEVESSILFPAHKLPGEDGEFYQFCYVTSSGQIRGASTPFQFKNPSADDFVELDDEETNMLVIRSKTMVLEENIQKLQAEQEALVLGQKELECERDGLLSRLSEMDKQLQVLTEDNKRLQDQVMAGENYIKQLNQEARDMMVTQEALQTKQETLSTKASDTETKLAEKDEALKGLQVILMKMTGEKDELAGENRTLKEQMELYKNHFTTSESSAQEYGRQMEEMKVEHRKVEAQVAELKHQVEEKKHELGEACKKLEQQQTVSREDKDQIDSLTEKLRNTEDKLDAAEKVKIILQEEIKSYEEMNKKMSNDLERSEGQSYALKQQLAQMEDEMSRETELLRAEVVSTQHDLKLALQEKNKLQEEIEELNQSKDTTESSVSSLHCLKLAQASLKERYSKMEQNYSELHTELSKRKKDNSQHMRELKREIEDLKERLNMAAEEYKALYIEKRKYQKTAEKLQKKVGLDCSRDSFQNSLPEVTREVMQTQAVSDSQSLPEITAKEGSVTKLQSDVDDVSKLQSDLDDVSAELQKRNEKKNKYKKMYSEEKERMEVLRRHFHDELRKKDEEIERLRKRMQEVTSETDIKVWSLEGPGETRTSIKSPPGAPYPVYMYGNPYPGSILYPAPIVYPPVSPCQGPDGKPLPPLRYPGMAASAPNITHTTSRTVQPLVYPDPVIVRQPAPVKSVNQDHLSGDQQGVTKDQNVPLKPLPAPLVPERLPSAKLSAVKSVLMDGDIPVSEISVNYGSNHFKVTDDGEVVVPTAPPAYCHGEERFEDALGEAMKICPVCNETFSADIDQANFDAHILSHVQKICPICHNMIEEVDDNGFEFHVNQHLDKDQNQE